jgi:ribosomal-protein-alanine N-acetyltransferase
VTEAVARLSRARPEDADALAALAAAALPDPWTARGFRAQLARPEARVWLARVGTEPAGFLVGHRVLDEFQILALAVAAPARRRGAGRALVEGALESERGVRQVHLEVRSNDAIAQAFYLRLGFLPVGRRPGFYPGGVDAILMRRTLPAGTA